MNVWEIEITDTFGNEANYSWVRRFTIKLPSGLSDMQVMRKARKISGFHGKARRIDNFGDSFALWNPDGDCTVMFINFKEREDFLVVHEETGSYVGDEHFINKYTTHQNRAKRFETEEEALKEAKLHPGHKVVPRLRGIGETS